jgi:hypothetical protein
MTDIEAKALALVNEARRERNIPLLFSFSRKFSDEEALCRAIEQHEAFKQEVSDAVEAYLKWSDECLLARRDGFDRFVIPKPDPLVEVMIEWFSMKGLSNEDHANNLRAALDALGFEIREKNDEG